VLRANAENVGNEPSGGARICGRRLRADGLEHEDAALTAPLVVLSISGPKCNQLWPVAVQLGALDLTGRAGDDVWTDLNRTDRVGSGQTYTTKPGGALFFPALAKPTGQLVAGSTPMGWCAPTPV
jgi:hypothetical protein